MRTLLFSAIITFFSFVFSQPVVVATNGMIFDIAQRVAGAEATVVQLIPNGTEPHHYRATAADVRVLSTADLILYSGYGLEARLEEVFLALAATTTVVPVAEHAFGEDVADDPHVWLDISVWAETPRIIAGALSELLPNDEHVRERAEILQATLLALDEWALASIATIPEAARAAITPHDAFGHFGARYGVTFAGIQGPAAETEPSVADIRRVADDIVNQGILALFPEIGESDRLVVAVQEAVQARGGTVSIADALYSETLGSPESGASTYVGIMIYNVQAIVHALGGEALPLPESLTAY